MKLGRTIFESKDSRFAVAYGYFAVRMLKGASRSAHFSRTANATYPIGTVAILPCPVCIVKKFVHKVVVGNEKKNRLRTLLQLLQYGISANGSGPASSILSTATRYMSCTYRTF